MTQPQLLLLLLVIFEHGLFDVNDVLALPAFDHVERL